MAIAVVRQIRKVLDLRATLASALIFVGGFCVIITLWYLGTWRTDVPGFWTYRSPTIGDGILLPLSAGLLIGAGNKLPPVRREVFVMTLTGGLGLAIGTLLQLIWWSDPHPLLNWTIPAPHKFSAPGIYHAIFLAAASAFFAAVIGRLLWRVRLNRRVDAGRVQTIIESPAAALLIACVLGFAVLVALDGYYVRGFAITNTITSVSATFMILIAVAVVALLMLWALGRDVIDAWRPFVWGCCLATAIGIATWDEYDTAHLFELPQVLVVTLVGTTICLLLWKLHSPFWWMQAITACLILLGGLSRSFALASSSLYLTLLGACAVVITIGIMIGILKQKQVRRYTLGIMFPVLLLAFFVWMSLGSHATTNGRLIVPLLSLFWPIAILVEVQIYPDLLMDEMKYGSGRIAERSYWVTTLALICTFIASAISSLALLNLPGSTFIFSSAESAYPKYYEISITGTVAAVVLSLLAVWRSHTPKAEPKLPIWPEEPILRPRPITVLWVVVSALVWGASPWIATVVLGIVPNSVEPARIQVVISVAAILYAVWILLITLDSFRANLSVLEYYRLSSGAWVAAGAVSLAVASTVAWLWLVGLWSHGDWASYLSIAKVLFIIVLGWVVVVSLSARTLEKAMLPLSTQPSYISLHRPSTQIFNDATMHSFSLGATILAVFTISQVIRSVMAATDPAVLLAQVLLITLPFLVILIPAFIHVISTTRDHLELQSQRLSESMIERAGMDRDVAIKLRDGMVMRMKKRFDVVEGVALPLSPYGLLAVVVNAINRLVR